MQFLIDIKILFIELEATDKKSIFMDWKNFFNSVIIFLAGLPLGDPVEEDYFVHLLETRRHHYLERRFEDLVRGVAEGSLEVSADTLDD